MTPPRFFIDHCVPASVVRWLRDRGYDAAVLADHLPPPTPDPLVIDTATRLGHVLLSLDGDFCDLINYPPSRYAGIAALQVRNHPAVLPQVLARLGGFLAANPSAADWGGKLVLVEPHRVRIRT